MSDKKEQFYMGIERGIRTRAGKDYYRLTFEFSDDSAVANIDAMRNMANHIIVKARKLLKAEK
jgi:hypothetical protein